MDVQKLINLYGRGLGYDEIAKRLDSTSKNVDCAISRIRKKVQYRNDFSELNEELLIYLYNKNESYETIKKLLNISHKRVYNSLKKLLKSGRLKPRVKLNHFSNKEDETQLIILYQKGKTYAEIAKFFKCSEYCIHEAVQRLRKSGELKSRASNIEYLNIEDFLELYNKKYTIPQLADHFFYSQSKITSVIARLRKKGIIDQVDRGLAGTKFTIEDEQIIECYKVIPRMSFVEIGKKLNIHAHTVGRHVEQLVEKGLIKKRKVEIDDKELIEKYKKHEGSHMHLALIFQCSKTTITKRLQKLYKAGKLPEYGKFMKAHRKKMGEKEAQLAIAYKKRWL